MKRRYRIVCIAVTLALMAGVAMPRVRTRQHHKTQSPSSSASRLAASGVTAGSASVTGSGTAGQLVKFAGDGSALANSNVTETKLGNIGIGTTTPGSKLSVQGTIETTLGGYKFPDGTIQTSALAVPLILRGAVSSDDGVITVTNTASGGLAIASFGGNSGLDTGGGPGLLTGGGNGTNESGGIGLIGFGGSSTGDDGGPGAFLIGGNASNGSGGDAVLLEGARGSGVGNKGGRGLAAAGGPGENGAEDGLAGEFFGDVAISGNLSKGGGSFKIDHPMDPENKYLYHSFVESPDMMNIYSGTIATDASGDAAVSLPDWFEALNQDFRYQLTVIGTFAQAIVVQEIKGNRFIVKTNAPNVKVCWLVIGTRHDAYANKHRIPVEERKPEEERGLYLHPDAFNKSEDRGVQFVQHSRLIESLNSARAQARQKSQQQ